MSIFTVRFCSLPLVGIMVSKEHFPLVAQISVGFPLLLTRKEAVFLVTKDQCPAQVGTDPMFPSPGEYNNRITGQTKQGFNWTESFVYVVTIFMLDKT